LRSSLKEIVLETRTETSTRSDHRKLVIGITLSIILVAGIGFAYFYQREKSQESSLAEQASSLHSQILTVNAHIDALNSQIFQLQDVNMQQDENNTQLTLRIQQLQSEVSQLQLERDTLQSQLESLQSQIQSYSPAVRFDPDSTSPAAGSPVTFTAFALGGHSPYSYNWTFGDNGTGSGNNPTHIFLIQGNYTVTLTVTDSSSPENSGTYSRIFTISARPQVGLASNYWAAFYYPWYCDGSCSAGAGNDWRHWNKDSIPLDPPFNWSSRYLPDSGLYSSVNATVIDRHLTMMDYAGLDFAIVSWWGRGSFEDNAFSIMLREAQGNSSLHLKLASYYELEGPLFPQPTVDQIVSNLTYIYEDRANFSSYFRAGPGGYPVVFVYGDSSDSFDYTSRWSIARDVMYAKGEPIFIVLKSFNGYTRDGNDKRVDGWHQYRPSVNVTSATSFSHYELQPGYSALSTPGFWSYGEAASRLNRNTMDFAAAVSMMASLAVEQAQFLLIETFNEWHEGTQVEPGAPVNTDVSPFTPAGPSYGLAYLEIIRNRGLTA
jgi:glycoprotein endo-alpha-1,2-mannosidase